MSIQIIDGFEVTSATPIDYRSHKQTLAERDAIADYKRFIGLPVYVVETGKAYRLVGGITNSNWQEDAGGGEMSAYITASAIQFNQNVPEIDTEGYVYYDTPNHTLAIKTDIPGSTLQVGQEQWLRYLAGENITNGDILYITHDVDVTLQGLAVCKRALADGSRTKHEVIGLATNTVASGSEGFVTVKGVINGVNAPFPEGTRLYLDATIPGWYTNIAPSEPYERILVGYVLDVGNANDGRIYVDIVSAADTYRAFTGVTQFPKITISPDSASITISTGSVALNAKFDGSGETRNYPLAEATFAVSSSIMDINYVVADYNGGNPVWKFIANNILINDIQIIGVYTISKPFANSPIMYGTWGRDGILLANKLLNRITDIYGIQQSSGMMLGETPERYPNITQGTYWIGSQKRVSDAFQAPTHSLYLIYHSGSANVWTASAITQYNNTQYDTGTGLATLANTQKYNVNYVYKSALNVNRAYIILSGECDNFTEAQNDVPPEVPAELFDANILVGRAIFQKNATAAALIESTTTSDFGTGGVTDHNNLNGLQGGAVGEYYHTTAEQNFAVDTIKYSPDRFGLVIDSNKKAPTDAYQISYGLNNLTYATIADKRESTVIGNSNCVSLTSDSIQFATIIGSFNLGNSNASAIAAFILGNYIAKPDATPFSGNLDYSVLIGMNVIRQGSGTFNSSVIIGQAAGSATTGNNYSSIILGTSAAGVASNVHESVIIGPAAGFNATAGGAYSILIGKGADAVNTTTNIDNSIVIGTDKKATGPNQMHLGGDNIVDTYITGKVNASFNAIKISTIKQIFDTAYTLTNDDNGKIISCQTTEPTTITVPNLIDHFNCTIIQYFSGQITFVADGVPLLNRSNQYKTAGEGAVVNLIRVGTDRFILSGDTAA